MENNDLKTVLNSSPQVTSSFALPPDSDARDVSRRCPASATSSWRDGRPPRYGHMAYMADEAVDFAELKIKKEVTSRWKHNCFSKNCGSSYLFTKLDKKQKKSGYNMLQLAICWRNKGVETSSLAIVLLNSQKLSEMELEPSNVEIFIRFRNSRWTLY